MYTAIFTLESIIKIISMGMVLHKHSYLRDPWNWLDLTVVIIGLINVLPSI